MGTWVFGARPPHNEPYLYSRQKVAIIIFKSGYTCHKYIQLDCHVLYNFVRHCSAGRKEGTMSLDVIHYRIPIYINTNIQEFV